MQRQAHCPAAGRHDRRALPRAPTGGCSTHDFEAPAGIADHEIDKAPRDFPNDLLHDLDTLESRRDEYRNLHRDVLELAVKRSLKLRDASLRKQPATGELLLWLRVLAPAPGTYPERLYEDLWETTPISAPC